MDGENGVVDRGVANHTYRSQHGLEWDYLYAPTYAVGTNFDQNAVNCPIGISLQ